MSDEQIVWKDAPGNIEEKLDRREEQYNRGRRAGEPEFDRDMERRVLQGEPRPGHPQEHVEPVLQPGTYSPGPYLIYRQEQRKPDVRFKDIIPLAEDKIAREYGNYYGVYGTPYVRLNFTTVKRRNVLRRAASRVGDFLKGL